MTSFRYTCNISAATAALASLAGLPVAAVMAQDAGNSENMVAASYREKLILSEAAIKGLTESLAVANGETELFKRKFEDLNTRVDALGIPTAGKETEQLQKRLVAAVQDMRLLQKENEATKEQLVRLTEAVIELLKTSEGISPKARLKVEEELRSSSALTSAQSANSSATSTDLTSGTVLDYKPDLALIVANLGARQGVKTGMPFQVWHGDRQVASARVVDVRDNISGAIVQKTSSPAETVHSGDTLRVDTTR